MRSHGFGVLLNDEAEAGNVVTDVLDLTEEEVVSARLLGLAAVMEDVHACQGALVDTQSLIERADDSDSALQTEMLENQTAECRARTEALGVRLDALVQWEPTQRLAPECSTITIADVPGGLSTLGTVLARLGDQLTADRMMWVLLEALIATELPRKSKWVQGREEAFAPGLRRLRPQLAEETASQLIGELAKRHKRAVKRISKDAMPPGMQAGIGAFSVSLAVVMPGSDAIGTFVGVHFMGLHGAAATSAGLAALGGGSLASGGFGMAGGAIVAGVAASSTAAATKRVALAQAVARTSSSAFIAELAALDIRCTYNPVLTDEIEGRLEELLEVLRTDWDAARPAPAQRRRRMWDHVRALADDPSSLRNVVDNLKGEMPPAEERNLATSVRATEGELRYLRSPDWKRRANAVPRFFGFPIAGRLIDVAEEKFRTD